MKERAVSYRSIPLRVPRPLWMKVVFSVLSVVMLPEAALAENQVGRFFGQMQQDRWIIEKIFPQESAGYYLDVGAAHAEVFSNSKSLDNLGWAGICIEPFPSEWRNRTCKLVTEPVYSRAGEVLTFRKAGALGGIEKTLGKFKNLVKKSHSVELATTTLTHILQRENSPKYIHYVSLDIEGAELEALKGFAFDEYKVGAWTIEHNEEEPKRSLIHTLLREKGYFRACQVGDEDWYLSRDLVGSLDEKPCQFS